MSSTRSGAAGARSASARRMIEVAGIIGLDVSNAAPAPAGSGPVTSLG